MSAPGKEPLLAPMYRCANSDKFGHAPAVPPCIRMGVRADEKLFFLLGTSIPLKQFFQNPFLWLRLPVLSIRLRP